MLAVSISSPESPTVPTGREVLADRDVRIFLISQVLVYTAIALQLAILGKEIFDIARFNHVLEVFPDVRAALEQLSGPALAAYDTAAR